MKDWYRRDCPDTLHALQVDPQQGLEQQAVAERLQAYGYNELAAKHKKGVLRILGNQLKEVLVVILLAAAAINGLLLHEYLDTAVILVIVVINTLLGFWQEYKADKALAALKKMSEPAARVRRGGVVREIPVRELVPGDILLIQAGNIIPADARLIVSAGLRVRESTLTGESVPVEKDHAFIANDEPAIADRVNMVFRGTTAVLGRGEAVVTATGMRTELGKIASMLEQVKEEPTPLQKRLEQLGYVLALSAVVLILLVAAVSFLNRQDVVITIKTSVSMAVAAIPEGLPAVVTISLALGARKLFRRKSLIRNLPSVETLGSVTVICSDKTGTLTQNKMTVTTLVCGDKEVALEEIRPGNIITSDPHPALLLMGGCLCNDAEMRSDNNEPGADGDPTETALVSAAFKAGLDKTDLERLFPRRDELPFSSERKRMTTVHDMPQASAWDTVFRTVFPGLHPARFALTKGAVDELLEVCAYTLSRGKLHPLTDTEKQKLLAHNRTLAGRGMRIIGVAVKPLKTRRGRISAHAEQDLIFIGMTAMIDPVRREVKKAVQTCRKAGIRPVMITGDHPATALAIAKQLGITRENTCINGRDLERLNPEELADLAQSVSVYARVNPEHKTRLVDALQSRGQVVAMTGDGVNDAPALKAADIGVAMGITGTDVSKQAADMVLLDDNFATIVNAVREGRTIYDNIKRFIRYILSGNIGEILVMLFGPLFGLALPLLPLQILWINLVTDGAPAVAMGYEPPERDVMQRPPFYRGESVFAGGTGRQIIWTGIFMALICLGLGLFFALSGAAEEKWRTVIFTTVTLCQLQLALGVRSSQTSILKLNPFSNIPLAVSIAVTFLLQLMLIYLPFFQLIFKTVSLSSAELGLCVAASLLVLFGVEVEKVVLRKKKVA
jgi:Ca2+-transporting ATPase